MLCINRAQLNTAAIMYMDLSVLFSLEKRLSVFCGEAHLLQRHSMYRLFNRLASIVSLCIVRRHYF